MRALLIMFLFAFWAMPASAQDCPHGQLDALYCDRDDDLLADAPADPGDWADPDTLIFSYTPVEDPALWAGLWERFVRHLEKATGKDVRFFQVRSYAAQLEALRAGRLHVAGINAGSVPMAVNCAGFVPVMTMATPDGPLGYAMDFIVPAASPIQSPAQLKGHTIAFVSPTSNSGFKAPTMILREEFGLEMDRDYTARFTGKHDASIIGTAAGDFEAAAVAAELADRMAARGVVDMADMRVIYRSDLFPSTAFGIVHDLAPELAAKVREAFIAYDWAADRPLGAEFPGVDRFEALDYRADYGLIRRIDAASGVTYDCR